MSIREQTFNAYEGFLQKFKPKKTTDDCYTPPNIYEAVLGWVAREYFRAEPQRRGEVDYIGDRMVVRPFWPGADFKALEYPRGCVVVDNPPFSILAAIVKFYYANGIDYFLFSPYLTNLGVGAGGYGVNHVIAPSTKTARSSTPRSSPTSATTSSGARPTSWTPSRRRTKSTSRK